MSRLRFPEPFHHQHPPIRDVNEVLKEQLTPGLRAADWVAKTIGSWAFIIVQSTMLAAWVALNVTAFIRHWDPYPFILMNLVLSLQAAYTAPIIMMSQNRQAERDRVEAHNDYLINQKAEEEIRTMLSHLEAQSQALMEMRRVLIEGEGMRDVDRPAGTPEP